MPGLVGKHFASDPFGCEPLWNGWVSVTIRGIRVSLIPRFHASVARTPARESRWRRICGAMRFPSKEFPQRPLSLWTHRDPP
jgi:hypothetical protein